MQNVIEVKVKDVYGRELIYHANLLGSQFANLLGVKTFNEYQIEKLRQIGYIFQESNRGII